MRTRTTLLCGMTFLCTLQKQGGLNCYAYNTLQVRRESASSVYEIARVNCVVIGLRVVGRGSIDPRTVLVYGMLRAINSETAMKHSRALRVSMTQ